MVQINVLIVEDSQMQQHMLHALFEAANTPKAIIDIAKDCCLPEPEMRPTFQTISEALSAMKSDDDDVRPLVIHMHRRIPVHADPLTHALLMKRFGYAFATPRSGPARR